MSGFKLKPTGVPGTHAKVEPKPEVPVVAPPNRINATLMQNLGWKGVEPTARAAVPEGMLDMGKSTPLTAYSYRVDPNEVGLLEHTYGTEQGYTPPKVGLNNRLAEVSSEAKRFAPLTWDAYNKLSKDQRNAVDFNTLLVEARQRDLTEKVTDEDSGYDEKVLKMFGERGGSTKYAPHTVDLLDKMGFSSKGQDLDEYLSLDRAISADELSDFKPNTQGLVQWEWPEDVWLPKKETQTTLNPESKWNNSTSVKNKNKVENKYGALRSASNQLIVDSIAIERAGRFIDEAMKDPDAWDFESATLKALTGKLPTGMDIPWGYGTDADRTDTAGNIKMEGKDEFFRFAYDSLLNPEQDMSNIWTLINKHGLGEDDVQQLFHYIDTKSNRDIALGIVDPDLRAPAEVREMAGLES